MSENFSSEIDYRNDTPEIRDKKNNHNMQHHLGIATRQPQLDKDCEYCHKLIMRFLTRYRQNHKYETEAIDKMIDEFRYAMVNEKTDYCLDVIRRIGLKVSDMKRTLILKSEMEYVYERYLSPYYSDKDKDRTTTVVEEQITTDSNEKPKPTFEALAAEPQEPPFLDHDYNEHEKDQLAQEGNQ
jgi:hypothetical protein